MCMFQVVSVRFNELSLERHVRCSYDSVLLFDGSNDYSPSLGRFCSFAVSASRVSSSGSALFVIFRTDHNNDVGRFSMSWTFVSQGGQG